MKRVAQVLADRDEQPPLIRFLPALASLLIFHPSIFYFLTLTIRSGTRERIAQLSGLHRDALVIGVALAIWSLLRLRGRVGGWTGTGLCLSLYAYIARVMHDITLCMYVPRDAVPFDEFALWRTGAAFVHPASVAMIWIGFALCTHACISDWRERRDTHPEHRPTTTPDPRVFD